MKAKLRKYKPAPDFLRIRDFLVGTHPDFRGLGLGREVVLEGIRRAAALGADKVWVGSDQRFYEEIGFQKKCKSYRWTKKF
jgi:predicted N-acetyltransferase YhbS